MNATTARSIKTLARVAGAGMIAGPLSLAALSQAHADAAPALSQLLPNIAVSGYARTANAVAVNGDTAVVGSIGDNAGVWTLS
jgi:hypothetical protein